MKVREIVALDKDGEILFDKDGNSVHHRFYAWCPLLLHMAIEKAYEKLLRLITLKGRIGRNILRFIDNLLHGLICGYTMKEIYIYSKYQEPKAFYYLRRVIMWNLRVKSGEEAIKYLRKFNLL